MDNTNKKYTEREMREALISHLERLQKITEDKTQYNIVAESINGYLVYPVDKPCKKLEVENFYIVQPLTDYTAQESAQLMEALNRADQDGEFNGKTIMLVPHDVKVMRAQIDTLPIEDENKWDITSPEKGDENLYDAELYGSNL